MDLYVLELTKEDPVDHTYVKIKRKWRRKRRCTVSVIFFLFDEIVVIIEFALPPHPPCAGLVWRSKLINGGGATMFGDRNKFGDRQTSPASPRTPIIKFAKLTKQKPIV